MSNCRCEVSLITRKETCETNTCLQTQRRSSARFVVVSTVKALISRPPELLATRVSSALDSHDLVPDVMAANSLFSQLDNAILFCFFALQLRTHNQESRHLHSSKSYPKPNQHPCSTRFLSALMPPMLSDEASLARQEVAHFRFSRSCAR